MNWQRILVPIAGVALVVFAWRSFGGPGVALVAGGILMWVLLHFTRVMQVLKRASDRPIGTVASAVMLNAKLQPGLTLLHVIGLTRALGEQRTPKDQQPEVYRWGDASGSWVDCEFQQGKLVKWSMVRPPADGEAGAGPQ